MKLIWLALACTIIALISLACNESTTLTNTSTPGATAAPSAAAATPDVFAGARANFVKNCVPCHGENAEGGRVKVEGKRIRVPSLKSEHAIKHTDEQLTTTITNGEEDMPSFKDKLKPEEITELVKFVRKEFQGKP
jgi:mono/diheme cytochrome c family protein